MVKGDSSSKEAKVVAISIPTAIAIALAWINSRKVGAAPPPGELVLPDEFVQLIIAIAASVDATSTGIQEMIQELAKLAINVQGFPANARGTRSFSILCAVANQAYRGNDMIVPEGMSLIIKSYPTNAVLSLIRVASSQSDATNINSSWPLMPNEAVGYQVQNADQMYVSATAAGSLVIFSVEKAEFKI